MSAMQAGIDVSLPPVPPSPDGPGARLKGARETAGLSLDQVAQQLKLAPRQVKALEDEDFGKLPGRTFARGFVRNYARLLNLDSDDLLALMPDAAHAPALGSPALQSTGTTMAELPTAAVNRSNFMRWLIPLVLVAFIVGAAAYEWYRGGLVAPGDVPRTVATAPQADAQLPAQLPPQSPAQLRTQPPANPPTPAAPPAGTTSTLLPNPLAAGGQAAESSPAPEARDASPAAAAPIAAPEPAAAPAPLVLSYRGPSWTEVRDRSGQLLIARLVTEGSQQSIRGTPPFDLVIGNAHVVTLTYQGKPIDLSRYTRQNVARLRLS
jgi:cytoskeleton protein RodZ